MLLGYNHNITYKETVFHIQTEDSGLQKPHIITLLYREGVILCSRKTSYADILKIDNLEAVIEDLMKEQHKDMLRRLKSGEFDTKAFGNQHQPEIKKAEPVKSSLTTASQQTATTPTVPSATTDIDLLSTSSVQTSSLKPDETAAKKKDANSLDDAILSFFRTPK